MLSLSSYFNKGVSSSLCTASLPGLSLSLCLQSSAHRHVEVSRVSHFPWLHCSCASPSHFHWHRSYQCHNKSNVNPQSQIPAFTLPPATSTHPPALIHCLPDVLRTRQSSAFPLNSQALPAAVSAFPHSKSLPCAALRTSSLNFLFLAVRSHSFCVLPSHSATKTPKCSTPTADPLCLCAHSLIDITSSNTAGDRTWHIKSNKKLRVALSM